MIIQTNLTEEEQLTVDVYNRKAAKWTSLHDSSDFWQDELAIMYELLPKCRLLEVGCGGDTAHQTNGYCAGQTLFETFH